MYLLQTRPQLTLETSQAFDELLSHLKRRHGFCFRAYKPATLMRRIELRMEQVGVDTYHDYTAYLRANPDEFEPLFNTIVINFTEFFRDPSAWQYLCSEVLPRMLRQKSVDEPIRVWSAACASGEESYSLAIVLAEALGIEQYQKRVLIFASDIDTEALHEARQGQYSALQIADMPMAMRERYFEPADNAYRVRSELRSRLLFFRHNLLTDAPMGRIDLLVCRNALIYFNDEGQTKVFVRFYFSLNPTGVLFLGNSESILQENPLFRPLSLQHRMFSKAEKSSLTRELLIQGLRRG